jgi:predicted nucleic acid-binding protein
VSVLDASAALEFLLGTAAGAAVAHRVVEERGFAAPELLPFEVLAVLRRDERRAILSGPRAAAALQDLEDMPVTLFSTRSLVGRAWELRHNFSAGDAMYVVLAEALHEPLLTGDRARLTARGRVTVIAEDHAHVEAYGDCVVEAREFATVIAYDKVEVEASGRASHIPRIGDAGQRASVEYT